MITLESIDENGIISIYDARLHAFKKFKLSDDHINDILLYLNYKTMKNEYVKKDVRFYSDGHQVEGKFLFSINQRSISQRFERRFGGKIRWLKFTPNQISKLRSTTLKDVEGVYQTKGLLMS